MRSEISQNRPNSVSIFKERELNEPHNISTCCADEKLKIYNAIMQCEVKSSKNNEFHIIHFIPLGFRVSGLGFKD